MPHPLVAQLRFTRSEFKRGLEGLSDEDARKRINNMNCISWIIGHLAWQEQCYWLNYAQGQLPVPKIHKEHAYGAPASTPPLAEVWEAWNTITTAADPWLDQITSNKLLEHVVRNGKQSRYIFGSLLQRVIYHYWFHTGQCSAIRRMLGHQNLAEFVGNIDDEAPYTPE